MPLKLDSEHVEGGSLTRALARRELVVQNGLVSSPEFHHQALVGPGI